MPAAQIANVHHRHVVVAGVRVFYRESGSGEKGPTLLLLHGFPASSHQYRRLIDALGTSYHVIAPDYPGFGHTEAPAGFRYSFETLTDVVEGFVDGLGLRWIVPYMFDFGGPVGLRLAVRRPELIAGLVVQNANAYEEGLSELARSAVALRPGGDGAEEGARQLLTPAMTRSQYETGSHQPSLVSPDGWTLDQHFLDQPGRHAAQLALALDYHANVALYPQWQQWLRQHQPPTLVLWGRGDPIFLEPGARAYLRDLPEARLHLLDTGHFALEEGLPEIAPLVAGHLDALRPTRPALALAVIGASGQLGSGVVREATSRGHSVTPLGRDTVDVTDAASVAAAVAGHDAVVVSVKGPDRLVSRGAAAVLTGLERTGVRRLVFLGGGGTLESPSGGRYVDAPDFPNAYRETALDQAAALDLLRAADTPVRWTYLSPPPLHLVPGPKTGCYRTEARDTPLVGSDGDSRVSTGDYAAAVVDLLEGGAFPRQRVTVGY